MKEGLFIYFDLFTQDVVFLKLEEWLKVIGLAETQKIAKCAHIFRSILKSAADLT